MPASERGFTLVEVMVALLIMAVIAVIGWRGVDSMARSREIAQAASEQSLKLSAVIGQFEQDLLALQESASVPALSFDGGALRLTRRSDAGLQVVVWALREGRWQRWAGPATTRAAVLQEAWMASQQLQGQEPGQLTLLEGVGSWQVYFYRGGWSNAQSSGDVATPPTTQPSPQQASPQQQPAQQAPKVLLPTGVRIVIELPQGKLTRDIALGPQAA
ncbi:prepilin-type N-terminal cleavage/methylation domain-containing protein [Aquincola sp. S2]|uniref:Prepilin-type N-terminal cleavage/methylation domain-containing protein n=1 Tax=Pseudaquabacterium terrae TaxID=2732868 RepID=A0ABX2ECZ4_9BURK|nr:prepilin-type N-terminal cleavage/methylation domain-containing protein [Aquabacterium terrae]NRF66586.1 prepilin-type N-terminal cleavage/methylation domain-containing protein [Aquabacterium terrae]